MASAITTTALTKRYPGVTALSGLDLEVPEGSIYGFLGANGAGKTTAIKILAGLTRPTTATATVAGRSLTPGAARRFATSPASTRGSTIRSTGASPMCSC